MVVTLRAVCFIPEEQRGGGSGVISALGGDLKSHPVPGWRVFPGMSLPSFVDRHLGCEQELCLVHTVKNLCAVAVSYLCPTLKTLQATATCP